MVYTSSKPKILIVDDEASNIKILLQALQKENYQVTIAKNGIQALERVYSQQPPDLILLDVVMPEMDGYEVCQKLKADQNTKEIPIIFITAMDEVANEARGLELGAVDYITKPFNPTIVRARVKTHLELVEKRVKSERLLHNILPAKVITDLKEKGTSAPQCFANVTVLFSDIVGFTQAAAEISPEILINELNELFTAFDNIIAQNHSERIKTIGDAYLAVCGMPEENPDHAVNIVTAAQQFIEFLQKRNQTARHQWQIRIGIHSGEVVGGIVGVKKYIYDIFGDAVNMASRVESSCTPMRIAISESTYRLTTDKFVFEQRPLIELKGKGPTNLYYLS